MIKFYARLGIYFLFGLFSYRFSQSYSLLSQKFPTLKVTSSSTAQCILNQGQKDFGGKLFKHQGRHRKHLLANLMGEEGAFSCCRVNQLCLLIFFCFFENS